MFWIQQEREGSWPGFVLLRISTHFVFDAISRNADTSKTIERDSSTCTEPSCTPLWCPCCCRVEPPASAEPRIRNLCQVTSPIGKSGNFPEAKKNNLNISTLTGRTVALARLTAVENISSFAFDRL